MSNRTVIRSPVFDEDELYHHGIKGMKWGIRRTPEQLGHHRSGKKRTGTKTKNYKRASVRAKATTAELKKRQERLKLEKNVRDLEWENANAPTRAYKQAEDLLVKYAGYVAAGIVITGLLFAKSSKSKYGKVTVDNLQPFFSDMGKEVLENAFPRIKDVLYPKK